MDISLFGIKNISVDKIHPVKDYYVRTVRLETKKGEKLEISLFSKEIEDIIIKKEK